MREMAIEERLVDADILVGNDGFAKGKLRHPVHQQEGIAVGQILTNLVDVHYHRSDL